MQGLVSPFFTLEQDTQCADSKSSTVGALATSEKVFEESEILEDVSKEERKPASLFFTEHFEIHRRSVLIKLSNLTSDLSVNCFIKLNK